MNNIQRGYDPIELGRTVERAVCRMRDGVVERRYYRFRGDRWYGGIATADCVGCNLRCGFCWSWRFGSYTTSAGQFYAPRQVAERVASIAKSRGYNYVRISGGEPTLCFDHLTAVIEEVPEDLTFILETNGILIGYDKSYARRLASIGNVVVRVSIKGTNREEFHMLTGAREEFFDYQLRALENLLEAGMSPGRGFYAAVMLSFSPEENVEKLLRRLKEIHPDLVEIDSEYVILYPHVVELLRRTGLKPRKAYTPDGVPEFMI